MRPDRLRKTKNPCDICGLALEVCICASVEPLEVKTRLVLIIHHKELRRTTNSGRLAVKALENSEMRVRGQDTKGTDLSDLLSPNYQSLLFYPGHDAHELTKEFISEFSKPIQLLVPDGNWRQASKVATRQKEISHVPKVMLKIPNLANQHLRKEHSEFGMSTLEAVARAMGIIEGLHVEQKLLKLYQQKLSVTCKRRGLTPSLGPV